MLKNKFVDNKRINSNLLEPQIQTFDELETFFTTTMPSPSKSVLQTFDDLKDDQYLREAEWPFRKRSYARGVLTTVGIKWNSGTDFYQPDSLNEYAGNVKRIFEPACLEIKNFIESLMLSSFYTELINNHSYNFGLHQIRTITDDDHEGFPVPEGYHQDGFDFVIIISFQNHNVQGGRCYLRKGSKEGPCVLDQEMHMNDVLIFNDRRFFHYASPIRPKISGLGYRDRCVLTFDKVIHE